MKNFPIIDVTFILVSALFLIGLNFISPPEFMGKYSLIIALTAYFIGKAVMRHQILNKK